ncbi:hypothetical protein BDQ17DRAFT_1319905 [Cyathus striatus]|nr:hypothetical protein BDQ17DRAFT_1319905 [Cyathus striatus]
MRTLSCAPGTNDISITPSPTPYILKCGVCQTGQSSHLNIVHVLGGGKSMYYAFNSVAGCMNKDEREYAYHITRHAVECHESRIDNGIEHWVVVMVLLTILEWGSYLGEAPWQANEILCGISKRINGPSCGSDGSAYGDY